MTSGSPGIATSDSAFPRWINCAVTGTDGDGYGGTLNCALNGALGVSSSAPLITLTAVSRATVRSGTIVNTATVCWSNPSAPSQPQQCAPSSVSVAVPEAPEPPGGPGLPVTGAQITVTLTAAAAAVGLGWLLLGLRRVDVPCDLGVWARAAARPASAPVALMTVEFDGTAS